MQHRFLRSGMHGMKFVQLWAGWMQYIRSFRCQEITNVDFLQPGLDLGWRFWKGILHPSQTESTFSCQLKHNDGSIQTLQNIGSAMTLPFSLADLYAEWHQLAARAHGLHNVPDGVTMLFCRCAIHIKNNNCLHSVSRWAGTGQSCNKAHPNTCWCQFTAAETRTSSSHGHVGLASQTWQQPKVAIWYGPYWAAT